MNRIVDKRTTRQAELSFAVLQAVVTAAGGTVIQPTQACDEMGVDAICKFEGVFSEDPRAYCYVDVDFQLKSTVQNLHSRTKNGVDCWAFPIKVKQLKKYVARRATPLLLALLVLPNDKDVLPVVSESGIVSIKGVLYWTPTYMFPVDESKETNTVYIPKTSILTPNEMRRIVKMVAERRDEEALRYGTYD